MRPVTPVPGRAQVLNYKLNVKTRGELREDPAFIMHKVFFAAEHC